MRRRLGRNEETNWDYRVKRGEKLYYNLRGRANDNEYYWFVSCKKKKKKTDREKRRKRRISRHGRIEYFRG